MKSKNVNICMCSMLFVMIMLSITGCGTDITTEKEETKPSIVQKQSDAVKANEPSSAYKKIINMYYDALNEKWSGSKVLEENLSIILVSCYENTPLDNVGYALIDLDNNGENELIIGTTQKIDDSFYKNMILGLYTIGQDNICTNVFNSTERNRYYYIEDNLFANVGLSGANDSFETTVKLNNGKLTDLKYISDSKKYTQINLIPLSKWENKINNTNSTQHIDMPILDEINENIKIGTAGSSLTAIKLAAKILDWGTATGLDVEEIREATVNWLSNKGNDEQVLFAQKLSMVDDAYKKLLKDGAEDMLESAGCTNTSYPWGKTPIEPIEAIMQAVGLR